MKIKLLLVGLLLGMSINAYSNYYCVGKVTYLGSSTTLSVSNGYGVHNICSVEEEKCKLWASMIMAAKMAGKGISIYYQSSASPGGNQSDGVCSDIGDWVTPSDTPYHVQLN